MLTRDQEIGRSLRKADPEQRALLDLSLRRRVKDDVIAAVLRLQPEDVAPRREAALDRLAWDLGIHDRGKRAKLPEELVALPDNQWPSDFDAPAKSSQDSPNVEAPVPADEPVAPGWGQPPVPGDGAPDTPPLAPAYEPPGPAGDAPPPAFEPPVPAADAPPPGFEPPVPSADAPSPAPGYGPPADVPPPAPGYEPEGPAGDAAPPAPGSEPPGPAMGATSPEPPAPAMGATSPEPPAPAIDATSGAPPEPPVPLADTPPVPAADAPSVPPADASPAPSPKAGAPPGGPPSVSGPARREGRRRRGGVWFMVLAGALIGAVLGFVLLGGSDDDGKSDSPSAPAAPSAPAPKPRAMEPLVEGFPGHGTAAIEGTGENRRLKVSLQDLPPREEAYAVWLYNTVGDARLIDSAVGSSLDVDEPLPADADGYRFVDVSREPIDDNPNHSGASVLRVPLADLLSAGQK